MSFYERQKQALNRKNAAISPQPLGDSSYWQCMSPVVQAAGGICSGALSCRQRGAMADPYGRRVSRDQVMTINGFDNQRQCFSEVGRHEALSRHMMSGDSGSQDQSVFSRRTVDQPIGPFNDFSVTKKVEDPKPDSCENSISSSTHGQMAPVHSPKSPTASKPKGKFNPSQKQTTITKIIVKKPLALLLSPQALNAPVAITPTSNNGA